MWRRQRAGMASQKASMLTSTIGLVWRPSWAQVSCSTSSSSVPMPPGSATKASDLSNISFLRWCMSSTTTSSVDVAQHALLDREEGRDDAGDATAVRQHRAGKLAHQAEPAAAVDEADPLPGHALARAAARRRRTRGWCRYWSRSRRRCCGCGLGSRCRVSGPSGDVSCMWSLHAGCLRCRRRSPIPCPVPGACVMYRVSDT